MKKIYSSGINALWVLLVVFLPITSFTMLSKLMGGTNVAPLSFVFLFPLIIFWLIPHLIKGQGLPYQSVPLLFFILVAIISCFAAFFIPIPSFKATIVWRNVIGEIIPLGIGFCFFLLTALWLNDIKKLEIFFRLVNLSGAVALAYTLIQAYYVIIIHILPANLVEIQYFLSASQTFFVERVNGLAFEPSWLAHQLNIFYLPVWLGLSIRKITFHKFRIFKLSLENILLCIGFLVLFLSFSRIGWLTCLVYCGYLFLRTINSIRIRIISKALMPTSNLVSLRKLLINLGFWFTLMLLFIGSLLFAGWILSKIDPRMKELFNFRGINEWGLLGLTSKLFFAERIIYWGAGFGTFIKYPVLGVGLGNSGFFFPQTINSFGYALTEMMRIFLENSFIPNIKNLWIRLLAETGIVGFSFFVSWLWVQWKTARILEKIPKNFYQAIGIMGQITIIGLIIEGFSIDTFALPYFWISLGLIVATFRVFSNSLICCENTEKQTPPAE